MANTSQYDLDEKNKKNKQRILTEKAQVLIKNNAQKKERTT